MNKLNYLFIKLNKILFILRALKINDYIQKQNAYAHKVPKKEKEFTDI